LKTMESLDKLPAPVLTLAQQKKSIGGLKKVQKRKVIHTLDSPLDIQWPKIGYERENRVRMMLGEHLTQVRASNVSVSREKLSAVPRKERAEWRKAQRLKMQQDSPIDKSKMADCVVGLRDVLKSIESSRACLVLCEGNPTQHKSMLTKLLIPLCRKQSIPLLPLKNFTETLTEKLNVPNCLAIALKVSAKESESPLHQLYTKLEEICDSCGLLTSPTNDNKVKIENQIENQVENQVEHKEDHKEEETLDCQRFYLKKPLQGRCFTPGSSDGKVDVKVDVRSDGKGFISLESISASGSAEAAVAAPTRSSRYYTSMRIKRLEPNANKANAKKMKKQ